MDSMLNTKDFSDELRQLRNGEEDEDPLGEGGDTSNDPLRMFIKRVTEGRPWVCQGYTYIHTHYII